MPEQKSALEVRPSPEALLEAARREESRAGKLRIFVGAAPGVGKTYEMLQTARARKRDGADVVVGSHAHVQLGAGFLGLNVLAMAVTEFFLGLALFHVAVALTSTLILRRHRWLGLAALAIVLTTGMLT